MRTRVAVLVLGVAAVLGTVTGVIVLPDRGRETADPANPTTTAPSPATPSRSGPSDRSESPTPSASPSPTPSASRTPNDADEDFVTRANLITTADFEKVGLDVIEIPTDARLELATCRDDGRRDYDTTLAEVAKSGPPVQLKWEAEHISASEQAVALNVIYQEEAADVVRRILDVLETCQRTTPTYGYYGPTHTERLGPNVTVSWLGSIAGNPFKTGRRAPKNAGIDGGEAVLRNGLHVAVLSLGLCASPGESYTCVETDREPGEILAGLSRAAALRLG